MDAAPLDMSAFLLDAPPEALAGLLVREWVARPNPRFLDGVRCAPFAALQPQDRRGTREEVAVVLRLLEGVRG